MFSVDFVVDEDEYLDSVAMDELELDEEDFYGPLSGGSGGGGGGGGGGGVSLQSRGCGGYLTSGGGSPRQLSCGRVRGLGRNRQTVLASQNRADFVALELELGDSSKMQHLNETRRKRKIEPWCFPITIIGILVVLIIFLPLINPEKITVRPVTDPQCDDQCRLIVAESIPEHLIYPEGSPVSPSTYSTWLSLIQSAQQSIDIGSFYWTLRRFDETVARSPQNKDPYSEGESIFKELSKAGLQRKIKVRIAQSLSSHQFPNNDTAELENTGAAEVRSLNFTHLTGSGVLHTKMWIIDDTHFWVGSANMDWRALTEVKELGLTGINCSCLAKDLSKIFSVYWYLGAAGNTSVPDKWPATFSTQFNRTNPFSLHYNASSQPYNIYMASSPPAFCPGGRTNDIDALLSVINAAHKFVYIAVMDYTPIMQDQHGKRYWPVIDDSLRASAYNGRGVNVRLLVSKWNHTNPAIVFHLRSLLALNGVTKGKIEIKWFEVPAFTPEEKTIPFARVNHNKYMLTESVGYIGTSNWEGSYFTTTAGVSVIVNDTLSDSASANHPASSDNASSFTTVRDQLESIFLRDWNSQYASFVTLS
ncbi:Phospholipase D3 [Hypsibius exemplaris]|uniref:Phospholipase D3 n=1 Tax=Hypsibius exemplaris TaxID=2072580 RepID=A0A1W0WK72_HYPEX|nr:Phospholipase D3 [Hypsibius exemplaris]